MITKVLKSFLFFIYFFLVAPVHAQIGLDSSKQTNGLKIGSTATGELFQNLIRNVITLFFTIGALAFIIMILWGAVDWILSGGEKEKVAGARKRITTAIIGLVLLSLTFVAMVVVGQILGINALQYGDVRVPGLLDK